MSVSAIQAGRAVVTVELKSNIDKGIAEMRSQLKMVSAAFTEVGFEVTKLGLTISTVLGGALAALKFPLQISAQIESAAVSFEVLTGSATRAAEIVRDLRDYAARSPLTFQGLNQATETLLAYGIASKDVIKDIKALGAVSRGDQTRLERLALAYGQVAAKGKLYAAEVRQFTESGFNPLQQIAKDSGKSIGVLLKEMEEGKIVFEDVRRSIMRATSAGGRFFGLMEKQAETLIGKFHQMTDAVKIAIQPIGDALAPVLKKIMSSLMVTTKNVGAFLETNKKMVPVVVAAAAGIFLASAAATGLGLALLTIGGAAKAFQVLANTGSLLRKNIKPAAEQMTMVAVKSSEMSATIVTSTTEAASSIRGLSASIGMLAGKFSAAMNKIQATLVTSMAALQAELTATWTRLNAIHVAGLARMRANTKIATDAIKMQIATALAAIATGASKLTAAANTGVRTMTRELTAYGAALDRIAAKASVATAAVAAARPKKAAKSVATALNAAEIASASTNAGATAASAGASASTARAASLLFGRRKRENMKNSLLARFPDTPEKLSPTQPAFQGPPSTFGNSIRDSVTRRTGAELNGPKTPTMTGMPIDDMIRAERLAGQTALSVKAIVNPTISGAGWAAISMAITGVSASLKKAGDVAKVVSAPLGGVFADTDVTKSGPMKYATKKLSIGSDSVRRVNRGVGSSVALKGNYDVMTEQANRARWAKKGWSVRTGVDNETGEKVSGFARMSGKAKVMNAVKGVGAREAGGVARLATAYNMVGKAAAVTGKVTSKVFSPITAGLGLAIPSLKMMGTTIAGLLGPILAFAGHLALVVVAVGAIAGAVAYFANRAGILKPIFNEIMTVSKQVYDYITTVFGGIGKAINIGEFGLAWDLAMAGAKYAFLSFVDYVIQSIPTIIGNLVLLGESIVGTLVDIFKAIPAMIMSIFSGGSSIATMINDIIMGRFADGEMKKQLTESKKQVDGILKEIDSKDKQKSKAQMALEKSKASTAKVESDKANAIKAAADAEAAAENARVKAESDYISGLERERKLVGSGVSPMATKLPDAEIQKNQEKAAERLQSLRDENRELSLGKALFEDRKAAESGVTQAVREQIFGQNKLNEILKAGVGLKERIDKIKEETFALVNGAAATERAVVAQYNLNGELNGYLTELSKVTAQKEFTQSIVELQDALTEETQGKDFAEQIKLRRKGLNDAQIQEIDGLQKRLAAKKQENERVKELQKDAEKLTTDLKSPLEIFREEQAKITEMLVRGFLTAEQAAKGFEKNIKDLQDTLNDGINRSGFTANISGSDASLTARQKSLEQLAKINASVNGKAMAANVVAGARAAGGVQNRPTLAQAEVDRNRRHQIEMLRLTKQTVDNTGKPKKQVRIR